MCVIASTNETKALLSRIQRGTYTLPKDGIGEGKGRRSSSKLHVWFRFNQIIVQHFTVLRLNLSPIYGSSLKNL